MTLIKSISGIRGTIGGKKGDNLSPEDVLLYTAAYAGWLKENKASKKHKVVIGRDARLSGEMVANLVASAFMSLGIDVVDVGLSTTPTVELAVPMEGADGGIIITASHNPAEWNALKLLNSKGEFLSADDGARIIEIAENTGFNYAQVLDLGTRTYTDSYLERHIGHILNIKQVDRNAIAGRKLKVVVDAVNSTGGIFVPELLRKLGVEDIVEIYCEPSGMFPHNPEPLAKNLVELSKKVVETSADLGIAVDPDVDRLVFVQEDGTLFGEEYTLVAVADYILSSSPGNTVSNLSSTRALRDVTERHGGKYTASAVGEVNVVEMMKQNKAVIGGEGNGGVIFPESHYGRDALVGIALFLSHLCSWKDGRRRMSELKGSYPEYFMSKNKIELREGMDVQGILDQLAQVYSSETINTVDGLKIDFKEEWVHLRKSNTEPIIRIYSEAKSQERADGIALELVNKIKSLI
ncbi:MAG TPA: phosphoglucosamine mutase [Flavobacteriales bacterium]|nr:phosphoglucosamine mutase [Flavobacteriales bacterium]